MKEQSVNKVRLGSFVLIATTLLVLGLYYIGSKKNIFHSTITISACFKNVEGLLPGNNVRFNGINVGTISKVYPVSDTAIKVEFTIDEAATQYVHQNALASIGTDGLLGNKLLNIAPAVAGSPSITEGCTLKASDPIQMDNALRTLSSTNENLKMITENLKSVSYKLNDNNSLWNLLTDTLVARNVKNAIVHFKITGYNTALLTGDLSKIVQDVKSGKGSIGALITDTVFSDKLNQTIVKIQSISDSVASISGDFKTISRNLKNGDGAIGTLLTDTSFVNDLNQSMKSIRSSADNFNENMEALKHSWPFKKYYRKRAKTSLK
jgi:phospholipid/cholesterol/gamma-HCH transport system substrate-binding protein